jgi:hypothetical protein
MIIIKWQVDDMLGADPTSIVGCRQTRSGHCSLFVMLNNGTGAILATLHQKFLRFWKIKAG